MYNSFGGLILMLKSIQNDNWIESFLSILFTHKLLIGSLFCSVSFYPFFLLLSSCQSYNSLLLLSFFYLLISWICFTVTCYGSKYGCVWLWRRMVFLFFIVYVTWFFAFLVEVTIRDSWHRARFIARNDLNWYRLISYREMKEIFLSARNYEH